MRKVLLVIAIVLSIAVLYVLFNEHRQLSSSGGLAVAERTWGDVCGPLEPDIKYVNLPTDGQAGEAHSEWIDLPTGGRQYTKCEIKLDREAIKTMPGSYRRAQCAVLVHEYGHLAGRDHSPNPRSIMYFKLSKQNIPHQC